MDKFVNVNNRLVDNFINIDKSLLMSIKLTSSLLLALTNLSMPITKYCIGMDKFVNVNY